jgi:hypothetical protein
VCRRCDREVVGPALCGQCVTIFAQRGAVDPSVRARKDHEVKLYQRRRKWVIRSAALALGGAGQVLSGSAPVGLLLLYAATLGGWAVVLRGGLVPSPWGESPALLRAVPGGLALVLAWGLGARSTFRKTATLNLLKITAPVPAPDAAAKTEAVPAKP